MSSILPIDIDNSYQDPAFLIRSKNTSNAILAFTEKENLDILLLTNTRKTTIQSSSSLDCDAFNFGVRDNKFVIGDSGTTLISGNRDTGLHLHTTHINNGDISLFNNKIQFNIPLEIASENLPSVLSNLIQLDEGSSKIPPRYLDTSNLAYISLGSNVGIGTDVPDTENRLHLYNSDALFEDSFIALNATGDNRVAEAPLHIRNTLSTNTGVSMKINDTIVMSGKEGGYIGIGTDVLHDNRQLYVNGAIECSSLIVNGVEVPMGDVVGGGSGGNHDLTTNHTNYSITNNNNNNIRSYERSVIIKVAISRQYVYILTNTKTLYQKPWDDTEDYTIISTGVMDMKVEDDQLVVSTSSSPYYLDNPDGNVIGIIPYQVNESIIDAKYCSSFIAYLTDVGSVYIRHHETQEINKLDNTDISIIRTGYNFVVCYSSRFNELVVYPRDADITLVKNINKNILDYAIVSTNDTIFGVLVYLDGTLEYLYEGSTHVPTFKIDPTRFVSIDVSSTHVIIAYDTVLHTRQNTFGSPYTTQSFAGNVWYIGDALAEPNYPHVSLTRASGLIIDGDIKVLGNIEGTSISAVGPNNQIQVSGGGGGSSGNIDANANIATTIQEYIYEMNGTMDGFYTKTEVDTQIDRINGEIVDIIQNTVFSSDAWTVSGSNIVNDGGLNGISVSINAGEPTRNIIDNDGYPALYVATKGKHRGIVCDSDIAAFSDASLKTDIEKIPYPLDKIRHINGVFYSKIDNSNVNNNNTSNDIKEKKRYLGVIAQNVEEVLPEVVSKFNGKKTVAYGNMVALLLEGIKSLDAENRDRDKEILRLHEELEIAKRDIRNIRNIKNF